MRILLLCAALSMSCAHMPAPVKDWAVCVRADVADTTDVIMADVLKALQSGDYFALLAALGKRAGFAAVDCAVHDITDRAELSSRLQTLTANPDPFLPAQIDRGRAWLAR